MSEEKNVENTAAAGGSGGPTTRSGKPQKPVYIYLIALFAVALLLMGLSFLMSHRSNQQVIGHLEENDSALQLLQDAEEQNAQLTRRIEELEDELSEKNQTIFDLQQELYDLRLEKAIHENADPAD